MRFKNLLPVSALLILAAGLRIWQDVGHAIDLLGYHVESSHINAGQSAVMKTY